MKLFLFVLSFLAVILGLGICMHTSWSNPDMTSRRLWIEYPWRLAGGCALFFAGMLYPILTDWTITPKGRKW